MKTIHKLAIAAAMLVSGMASAYSAETDYGYIILNNGTVIEGSISKNASTGIVTVTAANGRTYTYTTTDVRAIRYRETPKAAAGTYAPSPEGPYIDQRAKGSGFWGAIESTTAYSCRFNEPNAGFEEISVAGGYRVSEFFRIGVGIGGRWYWNSSKLRTNKMEWSMPIFGTIRGAFIDHAYRTTTPYYSLDIGGAIQDGFMIRPAIGLKIGELRNAFTIALAYTGQVMYATNSYHAKNGKQTMVSMISLKLGYEF